MSNILLLIKNYMKYFITIYIIISIIFIWTLWYFNLNKKEDINNLKVEINKLNIKLSDLESENIKYKDNINKYEDLTDKFKIMLIELKELKEENLSLKSDNLILDTKLTRYKDGIIKLNDKNKELLKNLKVKKSDKVIVWGKIINWNYFSNWTKQEEDELTCFYRNIVKVSELNKNIWKIDFIKLLENLNYKKWDWFNSYLYYNEKEDYVEMYNYLSQEWDTMTLLRNKVWIDFNKQSYDILEIENNIKKWEYGIINLPYEWYNWKETPFDYKSYKNEISHAGTVLWFDDKYIIVYDSIKDKNIKIKLSLLLNKSNKLRIPVNYFELF